MTASPSSPTSSPETPSGGNDQRSPDFPQYPGHEPDPAGLDMPRALSSPGSPSAVVSHEQSHAHAGTVVPMAEVVVVVWYNHDLFSVSNDVAIH